MGGPGIRAPPLSCPNGRGGPSEYIRSRGRSQAETAWTRAGGRRDRRSRRLRAGILEADLDAPAARRYSRAEGSVRGVLENGRHFGEKLRLVRERKKLTMREVAERAGVSESMVSQIERNKVSPALDTLLSLVDVLEIDIEYLFADYKRERSVNLVRRADRERVVTKSAVYERLSHIGEADEPHGIEAYILEIPPGGERGSSEYGHPGKELGVVIQGEAEFSIGSKAYALSEGDSISFRSDSPHVIRNSGKGPLKAFWIITPPKHEI